MNMKLLRDWVRAEIDYAIYSRETDEEGYRPSAVSERKEAERLLKLLAESEGYPEGDIET